MWGDTGETEGIEGGVSTSTGTPLATPVSGARNPPPFPAQETRAPRLGGMGGPESPSCVAASPLSSLKMINTPKRQVLGPEPLRPPHLPSVAHSNGCRPTVFPSSKELSTFPDYILTSSHPHP